MKAAAIYGAVKNFSPISKGLDVYGVETGIFNSVQEALDWDCDFFIQTNILNPYKPDYLIYNDIKNTGKPVMVIESPVFRFLHDDIFKWYRVSWNNYLFPDAVYPLDNNDDRWEWIKREYSLNFKEWQTTGDCITIALQKFSDSSLTPMFKNTAIKPFVFYDEWLSSLILKIKEIGFKKIILRPHPLNNATQIKKLTEKHFKCTISRDNNLIQNYKCVLTFNSLYAIDCLYNGIPVISLSDSSLQNQFAKFNFEDISSPPQPKNRHEIFSKLSHCQWREDEIRSGYPLKKLLDVIPL